MTCPMPPPVPIAPMIASTRSFAVTPSGRSPSTSTAIVCGARLRERLGGEHVFDLGGPDAEGERTERAVRGGVAVAADDGHPREGEAVFGPDDVDDPLVLVPIGKHVIPNSAQFRSSISSCFADTGSVTTASVSVGTLWSAVATVRSGRRPSCPTGGGRRTPEGT